MKRILMFLMAALMVCSLCIAQAEGMDFTAMTDDELHALVDGARNELAKRELVVAEDTVILEQEGVTVYLTGEHEIDYSGNLNLEAVVVNDSDREISVFLDSASINGWDVFNVGIGETSVGKKQKGFFLFQLEDAEISSYEEVEDIEMTLYLFDAEKFERVGEPVPVVVHPAVN